MLYQVAFRSPHGLESWHLYPQWAPTTDVSLARRWAAACGQTGAVVAILRAETHHQLAVLATRILSRPDALVPPGSPRMWDVRQQHGLQDEVDYSPLPVSSDPTPTPAADREAHPPTKDRLDAVRWVLEHGIPGDVEAIAPQHPDRPQFPDRMPVLSAWLRLRERVQRGEVGGSADGSQ